MSRNLVSAIFLIAAPALSTGPMAQNIYKCGATYSQTPCEGSAALNLADRRSKEQQLQSRTVVRQDAKTASALEKARQQQEIQARAGNPAPQKATRPSPAVTEKKQNSVPTTTILSSGTSSKGARSKNKEPEFFTATVTTDKKKNKAENQP